MEKGQPKDTTGAGPGKQGFSPKGGNGNKHTEGKARQDGKNHTGKVNAADHLWKHEHSVKQGPING